MGVEIHEEPRLSPAAPEEEILHAGSVVTVEPGIYLPGKFGVRIEDMAAITETGCENLTKSLKSLTILVNLSRLHLKNSPEYGKINLSVSVFL